MWGISGVSKAKPDAICSRAKKALRAEKGKRKSPSFSRESDFRPVFPFSGPAESIPGSVPEGDILRDVIRRAIFLDEVPDAWGMVSPFCY